MYLEIVSPEATLFAGEITHLSFLYFKKEMFKLKEMFRLKKHTKVNFRRMQTEKQFCLSQVVLLKWRTTRWLC